MAILAALAAPVSAQPAAPDDSRVQGASAEFDAGLKAFDGKRFDEAATHFEAADEAVPSAEALRAALTARDKAEQPGAAATMAAQAQRRYPEDTKLGKLAADVLRRRASALHRVQVTCAKGCVITIDARAVPGPAAREAVVYVEPGRATLGARFVGGVEADTQVIVAKAGGRNSLHFMLPSGGAGDTSSAQPAAGDRAPLPTAGRDATEGDSGPESAAPTDGEAAVDDGAGQAGPGAQEPSAGWSPAVFVVALGATAVLGGVTIWSGVDTVNDPGADTVREACRGLGSSCPEYVQGRDKQLRTNVLIGVTAGVAALTGVVGLLLTDWGSADEGGETTAVHIEPSADDLVGLTARF